MKKIAELIKDSIDTKSRLLEDQELVQKIDDCVKAFVETFHQKGKILFCGNGGSAADAQHLSAELSGRFYLDRAPLFAEALHVNTSYITAVANDYGYDHVYSRLVEAMGKKGDILVAMSTSGNSQNIINAIIAAREQGMIVIGMTGASGGKMINSCDYLINVPSDITPRIQECHMLIGHIICQLTEAELFGDQ